MVRDGNVATPDERRNVPGPAFVVRAFFSAMLASKKSAKNFTEEFTEKGWSHNPYQVPALRHISDIFEKVLAGGELELQEHGIFFGALAGLHINKG